MRIKIIGTLLACVAIIFSQSGLADRSVQSYSFDIARQPIAATLREFSKQTGFAVSLMVADDTESDILVGPLRGRYTVESALSELLAHSGLTFTRVNANTIAVTTDGGGRAGMAPHGSNRESGAAQRLTLTAAEPARVGILGVAAAAAAESSEPTRSEQVGGPERGKSMEEVIVTAQRREERLQDVPISISVLSGKSLDQATSRGVNETLSRVPGIAVTEGFQSGGSLVSIRGVAAANILVNGSSPIGFYLDSVPFATVRTAIVPDANAYDLQRIEVLRGPQGTLYGASAQNGVVRVLTKDANLDQFEFKARASGSSTEWSSDLNYKSDVAVNVPLIEDKLAVRAVAGYQKLSGWIDRPAKKDINDDELANFRLKVNAQPTEKLSVGLSGWLSRNDRGAPTASDRNRFHSARADEPIETDYNIYALKVGYDFSAFTLSSASSYIDYSTDSVIDATALQGVPDQFLTTNLDARVFAQEVSLNSAPGEHWRWSLGGMYRDAEDGFYQVRRTTAGALTGGYLAPNDIRFTSESYAVFGELTRLFADGRIELTGGLRYFNDDVGLREVSRLTFAGGIPPTGLIEREETFHATTPRAVLTWHPSKDFTTYVSYGEGFRSGAHQLPSVVAAAPTVPTADPDKLKNYELGAKGTLWGGLLVFDSAVYYIDWQDVQQPITLLVGGVFQSTVINGNSASGYGMDIGLTVQPTDALNLQLSFSGNDLTQDSDVISRGVVLFRKGERLNLSPKYTISSAADYVFALGSGGYEGRISLSANRISERTTHSIVGTTPLVQHGDAIFTAGAKFAISSPDGWTVALFADNVTNEYRDVLRQTNFPASAGTYDVRQRPRTVGLQFDYGF